MSLVKLVGKLCKMMEERILQEGFLILNLWNKLGEKDKMWGFAEHVSAFLIGFNQFNNSERWMQEVVYHWH